MKNSSTAIWKGSGKEDQEYIYNQSHALERVYLNWLSRFDDKDGTNPEELIAAAHAACFTMKLCLLLKNAGFTSEIIETTAEVKIDHLAVSHSHLYVKAVVPGLIQKKFLECAEIAKNNNLVSKALNMRITMEAGLSGKMMPTNDLITVFN